MFSYIIQIVEYIAPSNYFRSLDGKKALKNTMPLSSVFRVVYFSDGIYSNITVLKIFRI